MPRLRTKLSPVPRLVGGQSGILAEKRIEAGPDIALVMEVATGMLSRAVLTASGLSALIAGFASASPIIFGGFYALRLACKAFRSVAPVHDVGATEVAGGRTA